VITQRVREQLARDFPGDARAEATSLVDRIGQELQAWKIVTENDEVEVAALALADGDLERLHKAVGMALRDWRDLLVAVRGG
jgi:hypothetical protein